jgi:hypothetical protein
MWKIQKKLWNDMENMEDKFFFHNFHIISHFNLLFSHIFHIISLFNPPFFHIFHICSLFNFPFFDIFQDKYRRKGSGRVKRYEKYGRNPSWIVKRYGKYRRKVSWIVKCYGQCYVPNVVVTIHLLFATSEPRTAYPSEAPQVHSQF